MLQEKSELNASGGTPGRSEIVREIGLERMLKLTEDEALGLLDIVMMSPGELSPEQRTAVMKLSDYCRDLIREREVEAEDLASRPAIGPVKPVAVWAL